MALCKYGPDGKCGRKIVGRGMCSSHYRRWRQGKPLDLPVRTYVRYEEAEDGSCQLVAAVLKPVRAAREKPFAGELALLEELGLR
jgi:hypothetical protein